MNLDLERKNAFITGGSVVTSLAVVRALANKGVNIIVCARNEKMAKDEASKIAKENTPIGRFAARDELADFFVFLYSDRVRYCKGSTYYVDGCWLKVIA
jgi:NAD(P)-dependent dehydrogenase (short-subunit alcohol dehydrogenase family)